MTTLEPRDQQALAGAVLAAMPACVYVYDLRDNRSIFQNRPFGQLLGYDAEDSVKFRDGEWRRYIHPEDAERFPAHRERMRDLKAGEYALFEYRMRHADGSWHWILSRDTPLSLDKSGNAHLIVGNATDITEQKRAEDALREEQSRHAFLLRVGDRLRELANPQAVMAAATELVGVHLGASGVTYGQVDDADEYIDVERDWTDGHPSLVGRHYMNAYGPEVVDQLRAGRTLRLDDVQSDPRTASSEIARAYAALSIRALLVVPLVKEGKLAAALVVTSGNARTWSDAEAALVAEVADRTWSAVERARAEQVLRKMIVELRLSEERFQLAVEGAGAGVWDHDLLTRVFVWSARHFEMLGYAPESFAPTFESWLERVHEDDRTDALAEFAAAREERRPFRALYRISRADTGEERWIEDTGRYFYDADGRPARCAGVILDATERVRVIQRLRESEVRFRNMADHSPVMVWTSDPSGAVSFMARSWHEFTGQMENESAGFGWLDAVHPDDRDRTAELDRAANEAQGPFRLEYRLRRHDGEYRWVLDAAAPRFDPSGAFLGYIGSVIDITERRQSEDHIRTLMAEVNHRSKNMLAVVQAISHQSVKTGETAKDFEQRFSARLRALAASQDLLTKRMWAGVPLDELIRSQINFELNAKRVRIEGGDGVLLSPPAAQSIGMAFHELSVNALKHGSLSSGGGVVAITSRIERDDRGEPLLELSWSESGGPLVRAPVRKGFGHVVTVQALAAQIRASVDVDYAPDGLRWTMRAPLANLTSSNDGGLRLASGKIAPQGRQASAP